MNKSPFIKPYLKWAGGKRQLLPEIRKYIPYKIKNYTYYEPFVGAGALFFDLQPTKAIINDFNTQLVLTYRVIRDQIDELINELKVHQESNSEEYFYKIRSQDRNRDEFNDLSEIAKAARLIFLNKTCYNGLYRVNSQGLFNVPYGRYKKPAVCEEHTLRAIHDYLNRNEINIFNCDFAESVCSADSRSFVYFDPPYYSSDNTNFTGYQAIGFGERDQIRLKDTYTALTEKGVKCLLSNSDTEFIRDLFKDSRFDIITLQAKRTINSNSAGRGEVNEVLIKNWR